MSLTANSHVPPDDTPLRHLCTLAKCVEKLGRQQNVAIQVTIVLAGKQKTELIQHETTVR